MYIFFILRFSLCVRTVKRLISTSMCNYGWRCVTFTRAACILYLIQWDSTSSPSSKPPTSSWALALNTFVMPIQNGLRILSVVLGGAVIIQFLGSFDMERVDYCKFMTLAYKVVSQCESVMFNVLKTGDDFCFSCCLQMSRIHRSRC